jgi:hypothetical protein
MRQALHTLQGKESVEGTFNCAENGDCAHTYYVVQAKGGKPALIKSIDFWKPVTGTVESKVTVPAPEATKTQ